jgi:hypothetical protein
LLLFCLYRSHGLFRINNYTEMICWVTNKIMPMYVVLTNRTRTNIICNKTIIKFNRSEQVNRLDETWYFITFSFNRKCRVNGEYYDLYSYLIIVCVGRISLSILFYDFSGNNRLIWEIKNNKLFLMVCQRENTQEVRSFASSLGGTTRRSALLMCLRVRYNNLCVCFPVNRLLKII